MKITATFIDEISHDIPHQNWGRHEWDADFSHMKMVGIDTVILIRSGYRRWLTYPSELLIQEEGCYKPRLTWYNCFLNWQINTTCIFTLVCMIRVSTG